MQSSSDQQMSVFVATFKNNDQLTTSGWILIDLLSIVFEKWYSLNAVLKMNMILNPKPPKYRLLFYVLKMSQSLFPRKRRIQVCAYSKSLQRKFKKNTHKTLLMCGCHSDCFFINRLGVYVQSIKEFKSRSLNIELAQLAWDKPKIK